MKICGTTSEEDALLSVAMGADALGFILAPSKRQVTASLVADIVKRLPPEVLTVAVFRNESVPRILDVVLETGVRGVQLHGNETPAMVRELKSKLPLVVIKAFVAGDATVRTAEDFLTDAILLDAPSPGSGSVFDWRLAEGVPDGVRMMLAGGLNPENVASAIEAVHPFGVDVVSGVEASPGIKDARKLRAFVERAKGAEPPSHVSDFDAPYDWQADFS